MRQEMKPEPALQMLGADAIRERLSRLEQRQADAPEATHSFGSLLSSAAVVESFEVDKLFGAHSLEATGPLLKAMLERCEVGDDGRWRLGLQARREAFRSAGSLEVVQQLRREADQLAVPSATQQAMDRILSGESVPVDALLAEEAAGLLTVTDWFDGIFGNLPDKGQLSIHLAREKLLHPMRRLTGDSFVGRTAELAKLADYVGVLPPAPALGLGTLGQGRRFIYKAWRSFHDLSLIHI